MIITNKNEGRAENRWSRESREREREKERDRGRDKDRDREVVNRGVVTKVMEGHEVLELHTKRSCGQDTQQQGAPRQPSSSSSSI